MPQKLYFGIKNKPAGTRYASAKQALKQGQVNRYGMYAINPEVFAHHQKEVRDRLDKLNRQVKKHKPRSKAHIKKILKDMGPKKIRVRHPVHRQLQYDVDLDDEFIKGLDNIDFLPSEEEEYSDDDDLIDEEGLLDIVLNEIDEDLKNDFLEASEEINDFVETPLDDFTDGGNDIGVKSFEGGKILNPSAIPLPDDDNIPDAENPMLAYESMLELPTLKERFVYLRDIMEHYNFGLVNEDDYEKIQENVKRLKTKKPGYSEASYFRSTLSTGKYPFILVPLDIQESNLIYK